MVLEVFSAKESVMGSLDGGEEAAPLFVVVHKGSPSKSPLLPKNHTRDIHILSCAFLFIFCAYGAAQNLESTLNTEQDLGTISLGILYISFTLFAVVASPIVRTLGSKRSILLGSSGYLLFIASNLRPNWYTMVPASLYLGLTASIIWVGQGTYLTSAARSHAQESQLHEGTIIGCFNGEFWAMFAAHQVIGNLLSLALLGNEKGGNTVTGTNLLFSVFLGSMVVGVILLCFLSKRDDKGEDLPVYSSAASLLKYVVAPLSDTRMLLLIPLFAYSGLQQGFVSAVFTKLVVTPALGVSGVGGAMALYGAADAICSLTAGRFTSSLASITWIVSGGAFLQILVLLWLLLGYSTVGKLGFATPLVMAAIWGVGDGVLNTQMNALLGMLFKHTTEASFAQMKVWQSLSVAVVFLMSPYITLQAISTVLAIVLGLSVLCFLYLTLGIERSFSPRL